MEMTIINRKSGLKQAQISLSPVKQATRIGGSKKLQLQK